VGSVLVIVLVFCAVSLFYVMCPMLPVSLEFATGFTYWEFV